MKKLLAVLAIVAAVQASGSCGDMHEPYVGSEDFQKLKGLVGKWNGTDAETGEAVAVEYRLSGGGSALVETMSPGTPHEMITVYHDRGGKLGLTHYCAVGNQPEMTLAKEDGNAMTFDFSGGDNIDPATTPHMHALTVTLDGPDALTQDWVFYEGGQSKGAHRFTYKRAG